MNISRDARIRQQVGRFKGVVWTLDDPRYRKIGAILKRRQPGRLVDIGCGNGAFSGALTDGGWRCFGLELVRELAREALTRGVSPTHGDAADAFPFGAGVFDIVLAGEILEHQIGDDEFLAECNRVLRSDGLLILTTPNLVSLGNRLLMMLGKLPRFAYSEFHYRIYTLRLLLGKLTRAGFEPLRISASHVIISRSSPRRFLARSVGGLGEWLAAVYPRFGEMFVVVCRK